MESPTAQDACLPGSSAVLVWPGDDMGPLAVRMQVAVRWLAFVLGHQSTWTITVMLTEHKHSNHSFAKSSNYTTSLVPVLKLH